MKRRHTALIGAYILVVLAGVIWHSGGASAEDSIKLTVNSHKTAGAAMNNMQPGDTISTDYTVINGDNEPFDYSVAVRMLAGDEELYNILQMTLQKEGVTLYSGGMNGVSSALNLGSLAGEAEATVQMQVLFPPEAGNEFQQKAVSIALDFTATAAGPEPTPGPGGTPQPTTGPTPEPTAGPSAEVSPGPSISPGSTPAATSGPGSSTPPSLTPAPSPAASSLPQEDEVTVSEAPVPLGGTRDGENSGPSATPGSGAVTPASTPAPSPGGETSLPDEELPLGAPDGSSRLPDTASPWYNLLAASLAAAVICILAIRRLGQKK
ncbi:hypothetical protein [Paenibacillus piscarius]|uniref:hypothetical protein n=1 Tax=Paenibacillus piscarius TaxID=1089681 RepID=UPI001EE93591|nr:hypothetical protein [Paenibacillus piscarius]